MCILSGINIKSQEHHCVFLANSNEQLTVMQPNGSNQRRARTLDDEKHPDGRVLCMPLLDAGVVTSSAHTFYRSLSRHLSACSNSCMFSAAVSISCQNSGGQGFSAPINSSSSNASPNSLCDKKSSNSAKLPSSVPSCNEEGRGFELPQDESG